MRSHPGLAPQPLGHAFAQACAAAALLGSLSPAWAVLGGDLASAERDQARLHGTQRATALQATPNVHAFALADGSRITEYLTASGTVFAVSWSTRFKPDLDALLGAHAPSYAAAASAVLRTPGIKRSVVLQQDDLVVESAAHLGNFTGRAYLRSLVPQGVSLDALH